MKIAISGAGGFIGSALASALADDGHEIVRLVRRPAGDGEASWDPEAGTVDADAFVGCDAVIHLAGENLAAGRWNEARKKRILTSRTRGTRTIAENLASLDEPPPVLITASAIGYYGERGDTLVDETAEPGEGFLADVCVRWEAAAEAARERGIRVVHLRLGMVLARGGALAEMTTPFRLGLGGPIGGGRQWVSWIHVDDVVGVVRHALAEEIAGALNTVAPAPVRQKDFARVLGGMLHRPALAPLPAFAARLVFGEMADALLLASTRVEARRLLDSGYTFIFPGLREALTDLL